MDREEIVTAALKLLDEVGLDGVTVRLLAGRLGVKNPALYWHFPSKRALLDEMAQTLQARQDFGPPRDGESWTEWLLRRGRERRRVLLSVRDGARLVAGSVAGPGLLQAFEAELSALTDNGFTPAEALNAITTLTRYVTGYVLDEQAMAERDAPPALAGPAPVLMAAISTIGDSDAGFERGLRTVVAGIAAQRDDI